MIGAIAFGMANAFTNVRVPMIAISLIVFVISSSYPLLMLMDNSSSQKPAGRRNQRQSISGRNGEV